MKLPNKHLNTPNIDELQKERRLLLDGSNPKRRKEVQSMIDYFMWGIKS